MRRTRRFAIAITAAVGLFAGTWATLEGWFHMETDSSTAVAGVVFAVTLAALSGWVERDPRSIRQASKSAGKRRPARPSKKPAVGAAGGIVITLFGLPCLAATWFTSDQPPPPRRELAYAVCGQTFLDKSQIDYVPDQAVLRDEGTARAALRPLARLLADDDRYTAHLMDTTVAVDDTDGLRVSLSLARAQAVKDLLVQLGAPALRVVSNSSDASPSLAALVEDHSLIVDIPC